MHNLKYSLTFSVVFDDGTIGSLQLIQHGIPVQFFEKFMGDHNTQETAESIMNLEGNKKFFPDINKFKEDHWAYWYEDWNFIFMNGQWHEIAAYNSNKIKFKEVK